MIDLADPSIDGIGDEQITGGVHSDANGKVQFGGGGRSTVATETCGSVARDCGNHAGSKIDLANDIVFTVSDEKITGGINGDSASIAEAQLGAGGRAAVPFIATGSIACDRGNQASGVIDLADPAVIIISDEKIASRVDRHAVGAVQAWRRWPVPRRRLQPSSPLPATVEMIDAGPTRAEVLPEKLTPPPL